MNSGYLTVNYDEVELRPHFSFFQKEKVKNKETETDNSDDDDGDMWDCDERFCLSYPPIDKYDNDKKINSGNGSFLEVYWKSLIRQSDTTDTTDMGYDIDKYLNYFTYRDNITYYSNTNTNSDSDFDDKEDF